MAYQQSMALFNQTTAVALACGAALGMVYVSHRQIRGQTGDVAGAAQQVAEITFLIALCIRI